MADFMEAYPSTREKLEAKNGQVWDTDQLVADFHVIRLAAPMAYVKRKRDGVTGVLFYQHKPRLYWAFRPRRHPA
jgi:hypothetical protein